MARLTSKQRMIKLATELLNNEALISIFDSRQLEIVERWKCSDTVEKREACYYEICALEGLRDAIYATATDKE